MTNLGDRIIVLIDMDCFFCQVESRLKPELQGKPVAVVQYNQWRSGGIIAVNYEARDFGVTRHMRRDEAKEKCPDIVLVSVPSLRGKSDTSKYRSAGREVVEVLKKHCNIIERASVDEAYLDITELVEQRMETAPARNDLIASLENTFIVGYCDDESNDEEQRRDGVERWVTEGFKEFGDEQSRKLAVAGTIVEELRAEIYAISKFRCSAGISYNKILAKLACGLHKPNRQTILPAAAVPTLYASLPVKKVRNLGGKFGNIVMESLGCNVMADLMRYSLQDLQKRFDEKTGHWLFNIARGIDNEPVTSRLVCKSIGTSKNFPGKQAIVKLEMLKHWVSELAIDVSDRLEQDLEENERRATTLTVSFPYYEGRKVISQSRSCPLKSYKPERIASQTLDLITRSTQKPIAHIGIAATKFVASKGSGNFMNFFKNNAETKVDDSPSSKETFCEKSSSKSNESHSELNNSAKVDSKLVIADKTDNLNIKNTENGVKSEKPKQDDSFFAKQALNKKEESQNVDKSNYFNFERVEDAGPSEKPKQVVDSFFAKQAQNRIEDSPSSEPISPSTAILGSAQLKKALNRENLKSSFFMNFLKDSKPDVVDEMSELASPLPNNDESASSSSHLENSVKTFEQQKDSIEIEQREMRPEKTASENVLLAQLQEIFPDLDNIDRSVVQLLPIELQRVANSFLKAKPNPKTQPAKNPPKSAKSKVAKSKTNISTPPAKSFQNFFVKRDPNSENDSTLQRCADCNQMIRIDKYAEHKDFHMAQELQRFMNQAEARETFNSAHNNKTAKSSEESNSCKRRLSDDSPKPNKKAKTISSFFCT